MAKVTVEKTFTATLELTEEELIGLAALLYYGVTIRAHERLGLTGLYGTIVEAYEEDIPKQSFSSVADIDIW